MNARIKNSSGLTYVIGNKSFIVRADNQHYDELCKLAYDDDEEGFMNLYNKSRAVAQTVQKMGNTGKVEVLYNQVLFNGEEIHGTIVDRIIQLAAEGLNFDPMARFLENLMANPSSRAVKELYGFLEHENLPITNDGCFLAYKAVAIYNGSDIVDKMGNKVTKGDYIDVYTKRDFRNNIGDSPEVPRNKVDDDANRGCSHGLHVGALEYSGPNGYYRGDKVMIVKVNPSDVVSVPHDHSYQKVRCCKYSVVGEYQEALSGACYSAENNSVSRVTKPVVTENKVSNDVSVGDVVAFDYTRDGVTTRRTLNVEVVNNLHVEGTLEYPEQDAGEYRRFNRTNISNIEVIDVEEDDWDEDEYEDEYEDNNDYYEYGYYDANGYWHDYNY